MTTAQDLPAAGVRSWTPAQRFAGIVGVGYLLVGIAGFALTGVDGFAGHEHHTLLIFAVNPLHNVVHVVLALVWLLGALRAPTTSCTWPRRRSRSTSGPSWPARARRGRPDPGNTRGTSRPTRVGEFTGAKQGDTHGRNTTTAR